MLNLAKFISLEETDKDIIVSFAIYKEETDISSLLLHRALFFEELLPVEERGVHVTYENDRYAQEDFNMLSSIKIAGYIVSIESTFRQYIVDISKIDKKEINEMIQVLKKQNYDKKFELQIV